MWSRITCLRTSRSVPLAATAVVKFGEVQCLSLWLLRTIRNESNPYIFVDVRCRICVSARTVYHNGRYDEIVVHSSHLALALCPIPSQRSDG